MIHTWRFQVSRSHDLVNVAKNSLVVKTPKVIACDHFSLRLQPLEVLREVGTRQRGLLRRHQNGKP